MRVDEGHHVSNTAATHPQCTHTDPTHWPACRTPRSRLASPHIFTAQTRRQTTWTSQPTRTAKPLPSDSR